MHSNLKEFVQKFVQRQVHNSFPHLYIVDKQTGPFRKIQQAIDAAQPNSLIKISEGFYQQNLVIKKPLRLQPKSASQKKSQNQGDKIGVVLLVNSGNAISISLPQIDSQCFITGIKVSHSGNSENKIKNQLMEHQHILNIFQNKSLEIEQLQHQYVNRVSFYKVDNTILMLQKGNLLLKERYLLCDKKGKLVIQNCILSLSYLVKSCSSVIPAVCIEKEGLLSMRFCQVKGHPQKQTIGIVCKLGQLQLQNSVISQHSQGGVLIWGIGNNTSRIIKNRITENSIGVHCVGEQFKLKVYNNSISQNKVGIKVGLASQTDISRNNIFQNINGIQVNSAFPIIYLNIIEKHQQNGIIARSYKHFLCRAEIKKNIAIVANKKNGVLIEGQNNRTKLIQNQLIAFNNESGVKVSSGAFPLILMNKIYKNLKQGILIVQSSNAVIQKNEITHNLQCNVALGGQKSHHSLIIDNRICHSPGPGIILINSGRCKIARNDIVGNGEGIMMVQSRGEIKKNFISQNKNNGIVCEQSSQPKMVENFITRNHSIGAFFRDQSGGNISRGTHDSIIHSNIIVNNEIQIGLQSQNTRLIGELKQTNTIQGAIQFPQTVGCNIY